MPARRALALALIVAGLAACSSKATPPRRPEPLPAAAYAHYLQGRLAVYGGAYERAVVELRAAAAAAPDQAMIAVALIDAIYRTGERAAARDAALVAAERWPEHPEVWLVTGKVHKGMGKHDLARLAYQRAIGLDRHHEPAWLGLASSWIALGRGDRAEATYRALLREVPDSVDGRFLLAERLLQRGADRDAEPQLRRVLELDADHIDARLLLARSLRRRGKLADAVLETRQAFDRTGGDLGVAEELFWILAEADDRQGALDLLGLLDDPSAALETHLGIAHLYRNLGALDDAVRIADAALVEVPGHAAAQLIAAQARADRARGSDRADALTLALAIPLSDELAPSARALAAELLVTDGDLPRALAILEEARADRPDSIELLRAWADTLHARGDTAEGRRLLEAAVEKRPASVALRFALASYENHVGDPARAARLAEKIVAARKDDVGALNLAGYALAEVGKDLERAETLLAHARELAPGDPSVLDSWGWMLFRRGRLAEAEAALARAVRLAPHQAEILKHLDEVRARRRAGGSASGSAAGPK